MTLEVLLQRLDAQTELIQKQYEIDVCTSEDAKHDPDYEPEYQVWLSLEKKSDWTCGWRVQQDEVTVWFWCASGSTLLEAAQALLKEVLEQFPE